MVRRVQRYDRDQSQAQLTAEDEPRRAADALKEALPSGSHLVPDDQKPCS